MKIFARGDTLLRNGMCLENRSNGRTCPDCPFGHPDNCHYPMQHQEARCQQWKQAKAVGWGENHHADR